MRTDVKVGLITGILVLGGVVAYSTLHTTPTKQIAAGHTGLQAREVPSGFGPTPASADVVVIPAPSTAPAPSLDPFAPTPVPGTTRPAGFPSDLGTTGGGTDPFATPTHPTTRPVSEPFPSHPAPRTPVVDPFAPTPTPTPGGMGMGGMGGSDTPVGSTGGTYTIVEGDTLSKIAKAHHIPLKVLQAANPTADSNHLKLKQVLIIPAYTPPAPKPTTGTTSTTTTGGPTTRPHSGSGTASGSVPVGGTTYKVKAGDNLMKIAKSLYGDASQYTKILRANKDQITNEDQIKEGMTLKIPH